MTDHNFTATNSKRLLAAASLILDAIRSPQGFDAVVPVYIGPMRRNRPLPRKAFTPHELTEAMQFLTRWGILPSRSNEPRAMTLCT